MFRYFSFSFAFTCSCLTMFPSNSSASTHTYLGTRVSWVPVWPSSACHGIACCDQQTSIPWSPSCCSSASHQPWIQGHSFHLNRKMTTEPEIQKVLPDCLPQLLQGNKSISSKVQTLEVRHVDPMDALHWLNLVVVEVDAFEVGKVDGRDTFEDSGTVVFILLADMYISQVLSSWFLVFVGRLRPCWISANLHQLN